MTSGSTERAPTASILVLGLGNILLGDDGFGPRLLELLAERFTSETGIEFVDGGTQGLALLGVLANRRALVVLDALSTGKRAGTISVLPWKALAEGGYWRAGSAHEGNAYELLAGAAMLGDLPEQVYVIGVEPAVLNTGIGLSPNVHTSLQAAVEKAEDILGGLCVEVGQNGAAAGIPTCRGERISTGS